MPAADAAGVLELVNPWLVAKSCPYYCSIWRGGDSSVIFVVHPPLAQAAGVEPDESLAFVFELSEPWDGGAVDPELAKRAFKTAVKLPPEEWCAPPPGAAYICEAAGRAGVVKQWV
jgi:hypothetical protein